MSDLAINGGPRAVTTPMSDSWQDMSFWLATPVAPSAEWVDQTAQAFAKVVAHRERLSEIANGF